jgi:hypothetical protein
LITATYRYHADWNGNGDFSDSSEDISAFVLKASWEMGRDFASHMTGRSKARSCRIILDKSDSRFSAFITGSPLYGKVLPAHIAISEWTMVDYQANSDPGGLGTDLTEHVDAVSTKKATEQVLEFLKNAVGPRTLAADEAACPAYPRD